MKLDTSRPIICLITPGDASDDSFSSDRTRLLDIHSQALELGVSLFQLREKKLSVRNLFSLAENLALRSRGTGMRLLVNDRADIARGSGAHGVHLTSKSLNAEIVRRTFGSEMLIGVSTHSREDVERVCKDADFAVYGPVFDSPLKSPGKGLEELRDTCEEFGSLPILGLGGVDATNCRGVIEAGAAGLASIRSLNRPESLRNIVQELQK